MKLGLNTIRSTWGLREDINHFDIQEFAATHRIPLLEFDKMPFWSDPSHSWKLQSGNQVYLFQLPKSIMKLWLENSTNDLELKKEAIK